MKVVFSLFTLSLVCSCETVHVGPAEGPSAPESATSRLAVGRSRAKSAKTMPKLTLSITPGTVDAGGLATYTITASRANPDATIQVNYGMSGTASLGTHYSLSGAPNQVLIGAGSTSGNVVLTSLNGPGLGSKTATMTLRAGSGYKLSGSKKSTVTIMEASTTPTPTPTPVPTPTPTPTATPSPNPRPTPTREIWISIRTDGLPGSGTQADAFNGSTQAQFDALLQSFAPSTGIHLGAGTFRTDVAHSWFVKSGWTFDGAGIDVTTVQVGGNASGRAGVACFKSDPSLSTDYATLSNLTVDCNWSELSTTAPDGAGGEKNFVATSVLIWGSNNLIDHVRSINTYGSWANHREQYAINLVGPLTGDGTNNIIQFCRSELPWGNYGNPFDLAGWGNSTPYHLLTNSKVASSSAAGNNNGLNTGFTSGGVNLAFVKDCWIDSNTFTDCYGASYQDTGSCDGLHVTNNTVIRGWEGVGLCSPTMPKQNIEIRGNNFSIQNRIVGGGSYGVVATDGVTTNLTIDNNTITFDNSGGGLLQFWGVSASLLTNATISNNTVDPSINTVSGTALSMFDNRTPAGAILQGLGN